jgi:hypothetical protein
MPHFRLRSSEEGFAKLEQIGRRNKLPYRFIPGKELFLNSST